MPDSLRSERRTRVTDASERHLDRCPACNADGRSIVHEVEDLPVDSCRLTEGRPEAEDFPRGSVHLAFCPACGFLSNAAFDPSLQDYAASFEETQICSPRFHSYALELASRLIEKYELRGKDVVEIGCSSGYFLRLLCELGGNRGIGIDPNVLDERTEGSVRFVKDYYSERHADLAADLVVCRHTLEHIQPVGRFLQLLRRCLDGSAEAVVFVEVPDVMRILRETAFWDVYYEHCSYFTAGSLARAFRAADFDVIDLERGFGDQYLFVECRARGNATSPPPVSRSLQTIEESPEEVERAVAEFASRLESAKAQWTDLLERAARLGERVVLWGSGSKASTFTITLGATATIDRVVNINPDQHGRYVVGTGQRIVAPQSLAQDAPDLVICLNRIYEAEIARMLQDLGVGAKVVSV
jgi:SAM-dependent methyltransferase